MTITVIVNTSPKQLLAVSPNGRAHWRTKANAAKSLKEKARLLATSSANNHWPDRIPVRIVYRFRTASPHRDIDNHMACAKPVLDGIAAALGVNDSRFVPRVEFVVDKSITKGTTQMEVTIGGEA